MEITEKAKQALTVARLLVACMALSLIVCAVAFAWTARQPVNPKSAQIYVLTLAVTGPLFVIGFMLLRRHLMGRARAAAAIVGAERSEQVAPLLFTQVLIGGAMAEGFGFLGAVGYAQTGQPALLLACIFSLLALVAVFPTRSMLESFADAARYSG